MIYGKKVERDGDSLSTLLIMQQDEWRKLMTYFFRDVFLPEWLTSYGTGSGVQTRDFVRQQLALLNYYFSGNLFYGLEPAKEPAETDDSTEDTHPQRVDRPQTNLPQPRPQPGLHPATALHCVCMAHEQSAQPKKQKTGLKLSLISPIAKARQLLCRAFALSILPPDHHNDTLYTYVSQETR